MSGTVAVGIDGCPDGWVAVILRGDHIEVVHLATIADVETHIEEAAVIGIDIPMWFPTSDPRRSELALRKLLALRSSSVFATPIEAAIRAPDHATANAISKARVGRGVSAQAFALASKILEVDAWRSAPRFDVREVHPEASFAVLLGHPAKHSKKTWSGIGERRRALAAVGIDLSGHEEAALGRAAVDDVVDAAVAAWSAQRIVNGEERAFPVDHPDGDVIWA